MPLPSPSTSLWPSLVAAACLSTTAASAAGLEDFYRGRTMTIVTGFSAGGDYDLRARLLARHMGRLIPGNPTFVPQNMAGGAGVVAANWLAKVAPKDGTALLAMASNLPVGQAIGLEGVNFDVTKLSWIGNTTDSPNVINSWHTTGITSIKQVMEQELVVGATARASGSYYYPAGLNMFAGTKFKIVLGYPGGNDVNIAMERGEVGGRGSNSLAAWKSTRPHWIAEKKIHILAQVGLKRSPELPDVPLLQDLVTDQEAKDVLTFISADTAISRPILSTPDLPPDRLAGLRRAFDATMKDAEFLAEAKQLDIDISPMSGEEAQKIAELTVNARPSVIAKAKTLLLAK